jgi:hypothetical protein
LGPGLYADQCGAGEHLHPASKNPRKTLNPKQLVAAAEGCRKTATVGASLLANRA